MATRLRTVVVVGASLAGLRAVETLRGAGYDGTLVLVGAEPHLPYDRPPLSKELLRGEWDAERIALRRKDYSELGLDLRLGRRARSLRSGERRIELDDGESLGYDALLIATGSYARPLPGAPDLDGLFLLRTLDDSMALRAALDASPRVLVVGMGFIGAEVAASCRALGLEVTAVEPLAAPCVRGLGVTMGERLAELHRDQGVDLRLGASVERLEGASRVERARLSDGALVDTDLVVVGIGAAPETRWLEGSGLTLNDGIVCDATCAAGAPGVFAAGDCARWQNRLFDAVMRVEHWSNAVEMGVAAARNLLAGEGAQAFEPVPSFWSDQYDRKLQLAGRPHPDDEVRVVGGSVEEGRFTALYGRAGRLSGVLTWNTPREQIRYRRLLASRTAWEDALAAASS